MPSSLQTIHVLNGPNLNLLGRREPDIYGSLSFDEYLPFLRSEFPDIEIPFLQTNHEGILIDYLHRHGFDKATGFVLNAGGWSHTSIALRDAVAAIAAPVVEVHITDVHEREPFRHHSYLTDVCIAQVAGKGLPGYHEAITRLLEG